MGLAHINPVCCPEPKLEQQTALKKRAFMASGASVMMQRCTVATRWLIRGSSTETPSVAGPILCGRGDKKTKKGKRFKGSYGKSRPKREQMIERIKDKVEVPRSTPWPLPFNLI